LGKASAAGRAGLSTSETLRQSLLTPAGLGLLVAVWLGAALLHNWEARKQTWMLIALVVACGALETARGRPPAPSGAEPSGFEPDDSESDAVETGDFAPPVAEETEERYRGEHVAGEHAAGDRDVAVVPSLPGYS